MKALSIRQPYAELILRGEKTIEYRSRRTRIIGERFYIYAAKGTGKNDKVTRWPPEVGDKVNGTLNGKGKIDNENGALGTRPYASIPHLVTPSPTHLVIPILPRGVIVGSAVIADCTRNNRHYEWHLTGVKRYKHPRKPKRHPQPVWFLPF